METPLKKSRNNDTEAAPTGDGSSVSSSSARAPFTSLKDVKLKSILNQVEQQKTIFLSAQVEGDDGNCVLILEKKPFGQDIVQKILSEETKLEQIFSNDIYNLYEGFTSPHLNPMKVTMIYPATERHIQKYSSQERHMIQETPELYQSVVLPHIIGQQLSLQWLHNILDHKAEKDRILFEDPDPDRGFILLPDLKWDQKSPEQLYVLAICRRRDLGSLRDLSAQHLPILEHIHTKALEILEKKFQVLPDQVRMYLHYQPSYYHLHVHVCALGYEAPGIQCEKGHLLDMVICNLRMMPDYYSKATLTYALSENDPLYKKIKQAVQ